MTDKTTAAILEDYCAAYSAANGHPPPEPPVYIRGWFRWPYPYTARVRRSELQAMTGRLRERALKENHDA